MSARIFLTVFWIIIHASVCSSQVVKTWTIDSFQVNLVRYEQVQDTPGIFPIDRTSARSFYSLIEIKKQGKLVTLGGNYSLSKDSCFLSFLELPSPRIKNGKVGTFYTLGLCNQKITAKTVSKPTWNYNEISNATIRPLDSLYYNPYNQNVPFNVLNYNAGKKTALHPKMIEGLLVFFNATYLVGPYRSREFLAPHNPHFELNFTYKGEEISVLMYWGRYIVDGYVYSGEGSYIEPSDLRFWEANERLWGRIK